MKAVITVGVSASGKSYWADAQAGYTVINRDNIRRRILMAEGLLTSTEQNMWKVWDFKREPEVTAVVDRLLDEAREGRDNVIFSDTNLNPGRLKNRVIQLESMGYTVEIKYFPVAFEVALERDRNRIHSVGEKSIRQQWLKWLALPQNGIRKYKRNDLLPYAIIVDVDGTVAKRGDRSPYDWHRVDEDECMWHVCRIVEAMASSNEIVFMSGRDGICYDDTYEWLMRFFPNTPFKLYMRKAGDKRRDSIVKAELFFEHVEPKYNVACVIDDRKSVVRMWTDIDLDVIDVGNHYEEF